MPSATQLETIKHHLVDLKNTQVLLKINFLTKLTKTSYYPKILLDMLFLIFRLNVELCFWNKKLQLNHYL